MYQEINGVLAVSFTCPTTIAINDVVEIVDDNEVDIISAPSSKVVGVVCAHRTGDTVCTVATRFLRRSDERVAGEDIDAVGPFVFGASNKVYAYDSQTHTIDQIAGLVIKIGDEDETVETLELV